MKDKTEWVKEQLVELKKDEKNKNKGLIPRFHSIIADRFYGGTKESLSKFCQKLAEEGVLFKSFIRFDPKTDKIEDNRITSGVNKGMLVGKDGKVSTPIYWLKGDPDIPRFFIDQANRAEAFRLGQKEFADEPIM